MMGHRWQARGKDGVWEQAGLEMGEVDRLQIPMRVPATQLQTPNLPEIPAGGLTQWVETRQGDTAPTEGCSVL